MAHKSEHDADAAAGGYELALPPEDREGEGAKAAEGKGRPQPPPAPPRSAPGDTAAQEAQAEAGGYELSEPQPLLPATREKGSVGASSTGVDVGSDDTAFGELTPPPDLDERRTGDAEGAEEAGGASVTTTQYQPEGEPEVLSEAEASRRRDEQRIRAAEEAGREDAARRRRNLMIFGVLLGALLLLVALFVLLRS